MSVDGALLEVEGLAKSFGRLRVFTDLSFTVGPDELLGIVGPNGAGKSTLLDLVTGVQRADTGVVRFAGRDVSHVAAAVRARAGLARTYQIPRPFAGLTVFENVLVGARFAGRLGRGEAYQHASAAMARTKLTAQRNTAAGALPLLDRKRLELARALATRPRLLLLDEVAGGLSEHEVPELIETIRTVRAEGVAIVWIEHIVHALVTSVDRLLCLALGAVLADGSPAEVLANPDVRDVYLGGAPEEVA